jgi:GNAT superfamily N-acetyltransferase
MSAAAPAASVRIRVAAAADAAALADFGARTFAETFGPPLLPRDLELHLAEHYGAALQLAEIADSARTVLLAVDGERIAGYGVVLESPAPACVMGPAPVEVRRFYVDRPWQGAGVAAPLMHACAQEAMRRGAGALWLTSYTRNPRARRFYERMGFLVVGETTFMVGEDPQVDYVLECRLPALAGGQGAGPR